MSIREALHSNNPAAQAQAPADSVGDQERDLAVLFTNEAHTIRQDTVATILSGGMTAETYVEILSLTSRLVAVDTAHFALGLEPAPVPEATDDPPTGRIAPDAAIDGGWVPTVGAAYPPTALSLLPDEDHAMHELHGALYLSIPQMGDSDISRGLHRTQMELVAARTSLLNECFF